MKTFLNWIVRNTRAIGWIAAAGNIVCGIVLVGTGAVTVGLAWIVIGLTIAVCNPAAP